MLFPTLSEAEINAFCDEQIDGTAQTDAALKQEQPLLFQAFSGAVRQILADDSGANCKACSLIHLFNMLYELLGTSVEAAAPPRLPFQRSLVPVLSINAVERLRAAGIEVKQ